MKIEVQNHKCFIKEYTSPEEMKLIKKKLTVWQKNFMPDELGNMYTIDRLFTSDEDSFPTGYLFELEEILKQNEIKYELDDKRNYAVPNQGLSKKTTLPDLWESQEKALEAIMNTKVGIVASATGSGKSRLILENTLHLNVQTLILTPTESIRDGLIELFSNVIGKDNVSKKIPKEDIDELFDFQIEKEVNKAESNAERGIDKLGNLYSEHATDVLKDKPKINKKINSLYTGSQSYGSDDGLSPEEMFLQNKDDFRKEEKDDRKAIREKEKKIRKVKKEIKSVTIICYQSLPNASKWFLNNVEAVIIDECHGASAATIRTALLQMPNAGYRFFYSATPWRDLASQVKLLKSAIGNNLIYELSGKDAAENEIIARPIYKMIEAPKPNKFLKNISKRNWRAIVDNCIIANTTRNNVIIHEAITGYEDGDVVFIAVDEIAHMEILKMKFEQEGIDPVVIHGQLSSFEKSERIEKVGKSEEGLICIGTMAVGVGTDMPNISLVILGSGGKSSIKLLQRIGRGTRKTKKSVVILDFFDWFHDVTKKHSKERYKVFMKEFETDKTLKDFFGITDD